LTRDLLGFLREAYPRELKPRIFGGAGSPRLKPWITQRREFSIWGRAVLEVVGKLIGNSERRPGAKAPLYLRPFFRRAEALRSHPNCNGKDEIQGSLHYAADDKTVHCFGLDDVCG